MLALVSAYIQNTTRSSVLIYCFVDMLNQVHNNHMKAEMLALVSAYLNENLYFIIMKLRDLLGIIKKM
jgi:hypothetical protein